MAQWVTVLTTLLSPLLHPMMEESLSSDFQTYTHTLMKHTQGMHTCTCIHTNDMNMYTHK